MAENGTWYITISDAYTKWFVGWYNQVFTPTSYSNYLRNCRLENQWICMRDWFRVITTFWEMGQFFKLKATERFLYWLVHVNRRVHLYKFLPSWSVDLGQISDRSTSSRNVVPDDYDIIAVWELLIIVSKYDTIKTYSPNTWLEDLDNYKYPSIDWGTYPDTDYRSSNGVYYSWFVFINEVDEDTWPTNRVTLSHEINRDTTNRYDNATNFSARTDEDNLLIPYKIICPSSVQAMISTQQNMYIFCQDSVQYLDKEILWEYATNKTLRTLPLAAGNSLLNKNSCIAAWNFVFFMCKDKHIRTLGYTSWIYDPQIADLTDTQFWIQKWINDNIADEQKFAFAFFNKQDYTVEFHLKSKQATNDYNDIVLIRDLQHQQWLIDTWKSFWAMENYDWKWQSTNPTGTRTDSIGQTEESSWIAHVVAGWSWATRWKSFYYQSEAKYDSVYDPDAEYGEWEYEWEDLLTKVNPIEFEHNTVNMALGEIAERKLFNGVRLTWAINIYTGNTNIIYETNTALFEVNVFVDWKQICNKKVNRQQIYDSHQRLQLEVGWPQTPEYDPEDPESTIKYRRLLFPIDLVLDQWMVRRKWKRIRVQVKSKTPWADLYLSGLSIRATPIWHFDLSDKF